MGGAEWGLGRGKKELMHNNSLQPAIVLVMTDKKGGKYFDITREPRKENVLFHTPIEGHEK